MRESIFRAQDEKNSVGRGKNSNNTRRKGPIKSYDQTKEFVERQFIGVEVCPINQFWVDLAHCILSSKQQEEFLSHNFIYCQNFLSAFAALTFLDLPLESRETELSVDGEGIKV